MATVLTGLQNKDLIERHPSPAHAKVMIATPTEQGMRLLDRAYQEIIVLERALTDAFTPAEHAAFCELLERATAVLAEQTPRAETNPTS
jgi:DNA-binding MarR family transcriptional regulator